MQTKMISWQENAYDIGLVQIQRAVEMLGYRETSKASGLSINTLQKIMKTEYNKLKLRPNTMRKIMKIGQEQEEFEEKLFKLDTN